MAGFVLASSGFWLPLAPVNAATLIELTTTRNEPDDEEQRNIPSDRFHTFPLIIGDSFAAPKSTVGGDVKDFIFRWILCQKPNPYDEQTAKAWFLRAEEVKEG